MINILSDRMRSRLVKWLARRGLRIKRLDAQSTRYLLSSYDASQPLPEGAEAALAGAPPQLVALRRAYAQLNIPATQHSQWSEAQLSENLALPWFRGDNVYVWQFRQMRSEVRIKQYLALLDIAARDQLGLLSKLGEDGLFGCWTFQYQNYPAISRDLLDSVNEINFLQEHTGLQQRQNLRVLDIGAGYGRLAHRMCTALGNIERYDCIDAIPESTFLCDFYLKFRGVDERARAVPLHQIDQLQERYDLAVNIHSFSECRRDAIRWWLQEVAKREIPWLLIVPNDPETFLSTESDGSKQDFFPDVEAAGYELKVKRPTYVDDNLRELIGVRDHFFLFQRRSQ